MIVNGKYVETLVDKILVGQLELPRIWGWVVVCRDRESSRAFHSEAGGGTRMQHLRGTQSMEMVSYWSILPNVTPNSISGFLTLWYI